MITIYHRTARDGELVLLSKLRPGAWVHVVEPTEAELKRIATDCDLDSDLLTDAKDIYEAPRIETEDDKLYIFSRYCYPEGTEIATEPLLIAITPKYIVTVMRTKTDVLDRLISGKRELITTQKTKALLQILAAVNSSYRNQLTKVSRQILRIRAQMRHAEISNTDFVRFIELEEDLNEFEAALQPQAVVLKNLIKGKYLRLYEDDRDLIEDLTLGSTELIELTRSRLHTLVNIRQAYEAIATNNLNSTFKRLTSIAIFLTIPTILGGLWGMNVALPFSDHPQAFWFVLGLIATCSSLAVWLFNRKKWL